MKLVELKYKYWHDQIRASANDINKITVYISLKYITSTTHR